MASEQSIQITDIIGKSGKYQFLALAIAFYVNALMGTVHVFVQLLCPELDLLVYWRNEDLTFNETVFKSESCRLQDVLSHNGLGNNSNHTFILKYKSPYSHNSLTEQLSLICERSSLVSLANSLQLVGCLIGSIISGLLAERYGRRPVTLCFLFIGLAANVCILIQRNAIVFLVACFIYGGTIVPTFQISFIPVVEVIQTSKRVPYGVITRYGAVFGQMLLTVVAWTTKDWFYIQLVQTVLCGTCFVFSWYILESPMWLVVRGRHDEAKRNLLLIAKRNGKNIQDVASSVDLWLSQMKVRSTTRGSSEDGKLTDLFKHLIIVKYTVCVSFIMVSSMFIYFALIMNVQSVGSSFYEDLAISNAFAFGSGIITFILLSRISIKRINIIALLVLSAICIAYIFTYEIPLARTIISILARIFMSPTYMTMYIYLSEIYPTSIRVLGTSFCSMIARIPSIASPFCKELGKTTAPYVPFIVFTTMNLASVISFMLLPDTKNRPLIQTVEELKKRKKEDRSARTRQIN